MSGRNRWMGVILAGGMAIGCGGEEPAPAVTPAAKAPAPPTTPTAAAQPPAMDTTKITITPIKRPEPREKPAESDNGPAKTGALGAAISSMGGDAVLKFNPFKPPKLDQLAATVPEKDDENKAVRLIGFVERGELKALLSFDGKLQSLAVGDVYNNVSIVAISPPSVKLRQGQREWDTALFKQPIINTTGSTSGMSVGSPQVTIGTKDSNTSRDSAKFDQLFPKSNTSNNPLAAPGAPGVRPTVDADRDSGLRPTPRDTLPSGTKTPTPIPPPAPPMIPSFSPVQPAQ